MRIWVGNLKFGVPSAKMEKELRKMFREFGTVWHVDIDTSRGFAFLEMPNFRSAETAITELNGISLFGRTLRVDERREGISNVSCFGTHRRDKAKTTTRWSRMASRG